MRQTANMRRVPARDRVSCPERRPVNPHILRAQLQELAKLQSSVLVTPCRLVFVFVGSMVMVLLISCSVDTVNFTYEALENEPGYLNMSHKPYVFDFQWAQQSRGDMLAHYGYKSSFKKIEKRSGLTMQEFWDLYDGKWPVIVTDIVPEWKAYKQWSKEFFSKKYGADRVVLKAVQGRLQEGVAHIRSMQEFLGLLDQEVNPRAWTYMEDEMFLYIRPELKDYVQPNRLLEENFFNLFPAEIRPWDCMMLWGSKFSRSTLHMDPYNWTAVSAVVWGRKLWKLFPPDQDQYLYLQPKHKCGFPLECYKYDSQIDAFDVDYWRYPKFRKAEYLEVEQNSGELLIIPTGWYHQAYNDEETLSISSQIMNRNNYLAVLEEILKGKNMNRKKLPAHFHTLLPPDQVKLFMSLLPKTVLEHGREVTQSWQQTLEKIRNRTVDLEQAV